MTTVEFTRTFHSGNLKGLSHNDKIEFVSLEAAIHWVRAIKANKSLEYTLTAYCFI